MNPFSRSLPPFGVAALLALVVGVCSPAQGREQKERLLYDVMFGGLHIADVVVSLDQSKVTFDSRLEMRTRGVAEAFQDFRADVKSTGAFNADLGGVIPATYSRSWRSPEIATEMTMTYDAATGAPNQLAERVFNPVTGEAVPEDKLPWNTKRKPVPPVPEKLRIGALDPVTAFIASRHQIMESGKTEVRVPIYDGRRRYDIISTKGEAKTYTIRGKEHMLVPVQARLEPVFGFEEETEERMREAETKILFSTDARFVPVQVILSTNLFSSVMNLVAECNEDPTPCNSVGPSEQQLGAAP
ncbi:MAG: DUF3108 domain-containing protein [Rhodospirillaceae bacterium]|nr:DUF3108 domain-containing protein [Rhodospirillaceae bacterium]